jgi:Lsr2
MAKTVIVKLTDDIDGGDADETVHFSLDGKSYEIDVNSDNASRVRAAFAPFIAKGRVSGNSAARTRAARPSTGSSDKTLFSQLSSEEKTRFRTWANMATARRISDSRVNSWVAAGKP